MQEILAPYLVPARPAMPISVFRKLSFQSLSGISPTEVAAEVARLNAHPEFVEVVASRQGEFLSAGSYTVRAAALQQTQNVAYVYLSVL